MIGEKIIGVRNETPNKPYFFHNVTNLLFLFVNNFLFLLNTLSNHLLNPGPKVERIITVVIIPNIVTITVSQKVNPNAIPIVGPPTNLNILARNTDRYFAKTDKTKITIQQYTYNTYRLGVKFPPLLYQSVCWTTSLVE